jgi:phospholipase C
MESGAASGSTSNLDKIDHIVVLMMENRSFDHMLGYLSLEGVVPEVDGLKAEYGNKDADGTFHACTPIGTRLINEKVLDPGHGEKDVARQLKGRNAGFVTTYARSLERNKKKVPYPAGLVFDPTVVLGYQRASDVPVYDYIARNWAVCDRWFSSLPGPTWENRLFAVTGGVGPKATPSIFGHVPKAFKNAPIYDRPAFVRWLDEADWRWYSHDPGLLRLMDSRYRPGGSKGAGEDDNFAYFNRRTLFERRTFLDDAHNGKLPHVSWIDPNFVDFRAFGPPGSNDDHPPSRVMLGQELVLNVITALMRAPKKVWEKTLLLITYDEHGGFFDHVVPGDFPVAGDPNASYGVRVPALAVSPWIDHGVSHAVFDHTSIIKTILTRFSPDLKGGLKAMGPRTRAAKDLGELLTAPKARPPAPQGELQQLADMVATWKKAAYKGRLLEEPTDGEKAFDKISDLQRDIIGNAIALRQGDDGIPPDKP